MLLAEIAASARDRGMTMADLLESLYARYGFGLEETLSISRIGLEGQAAIARTMETLRADGGTGLEGLGVTVLRDYESGEELRLEDGSTAPLELPQSNVLYYELNAPDWICVRPSGTEPKIKVYFGAYGQDRDAVRRRLDEMKAQFGTRIEQVLDDNG